MINSNESNPVLVEVDERKVASVVLNRPAVNNAYDGDFIQCMVRPCGARGFVDPGDAVLHQCIRPLIGACAPGHHGYQRACDLISG
jgi:hypothetical protein